MDKYKNLKGLGWPFFAAKHFKVAFDESDVKYINNVIKTDKIYRLVIQAYNSWDVIAAINDPQKVDKEIDGTKFISHQEFVYKNFIETCNLVHFLSKFLDDPQCPKRVKYFLYNYIGGTLDAIKEADNYNYFLQRSFFTECWMEICR